MLKLDTLLCKKVYCPEDSQAAVKLFVGIELGLVAAIEEFK
jgi:hypothetical protein